MFVISRCFNWQDIHSIPKIGLRDVLTLFLVACDWRLGQQYYVPQDSQMQFDVGLAQVQLVFYWAPQVFL
jgi:hypothetical protein